MGNLSPSNLYEICIILIRKLLYHIFNISDVFVKNLDKQANKEKTKEIWIQNRD